MSQLAHVEADHISAVIYDPINNQLYFSTKQWIYRTNPEGSSVQVVFDDSICKFAPFPPLYSLTQGVKFNREYSACFLYLQMTPFGAWIWTGSQGTFMVSLREGTYLRANQMQLLECLTATL